VGLAVAISFVAYLVGSFSQGLSQGLWSGLGKLIGPEESIRLSPRGYQGLEDLLTPRAVEGRLTSPAKARELANEVIGELDLIKARLLQGERALHNEIDRLHSEADFLGAILPPLIAVGVIAVLAIPVGQIGSLENSVGLVKGFLVVGVVILACMLGVQGILIYQRANDKLIDAVFLDQVRSPALDRWDREASPPVVASDR